MAIGVALAGAGGALFIWLVHKLSAPLLRRIHKMPDSRWKRLLLTGELPPDNGSGRRK